MTIVQNVGHDLVNGDSEKYYELIEDFIQEPISYPSEYNKEED